MMLLPITQSQVAMVDDAKFADVSRWKWRANWSLTSKSYYVERDTTVNGKRVTFSLHRYLMKLEKGDKRHVDHINGDTLDNRLENLRVVTCSQNSMNKGAYSGNKCGYKGVSFHTQSGRWRATIVVDGKQHSLGLHDSPEDAHRAYRSAAQRLHGEFANFGVVPPKQGAPQCQLPQQ